MITEDKESLPLSTALEQICQYIKEGRSYDAHYAAKKIATSLRNKTLVIKTINNQPKGEKNEKNIK